MNKPNPINLLEALFATTALSLVPICVTIVHADVIVIGTIRLIIATLGIFLFLYFRNQFLKLTLNQWRSISLIGLLFGAHWITFFISIKMATPSIAIIGVSTYGVHLIFFNWLFSKRRPTLKNLLAILLAVTGSLITVPEFSFANSGTIGLLVGVSSGLFYAVIPIVHQRHRDIPNGMRTFAQFFVALLIFLLLTPWGNWHFPASDWPYLIFMGVVCTLIGHALWVSASTQLPIQIISSIFYMGLPFTVFFEMTLLDKEVDTTTLIGAALIVTANFINIDWRNLKTANS